MLNGSTLVTIERLIEVFSLHQIDLDLFSDVNDHIQDILMLQS